jgi:hypothetical protein
MYTGSSLSIANSNYPLTGTWYNNWFVRIKSATQPVLTGTLSHAILYCGTGALTSVDISNLDGIPNLPNNTETFS